MNTFDLIQHAAPVVGAFAPGVLAHLAARTLLTPRALAPAPWESDALARAERVTFRFGLSGLRWGQRGPVVLMQHGWQGRPTQFAGFIEPLVASGRQVIALDAPGHGRSPARAEFVVGFTEALLEAAAELRDVEAVVGHSMGGAAALFALATGLSVARVVTIAAPAALARMLGHVADAMGLPPHARARFLDLVDRRLGIPARVLDTAGVARAIRADALVVHDREDREVPFAEARALAGAWPSARLLATTGLGHARVLNDAGVVEAVTRFLTAAPARRARAA